MRRPRRAIWLGIALTALTIALGGCGGGSDLASAGAHPGSDPRLSPSSTSRPAGTPAVESTTAGRADHRMFAYYYLWWDTAHWHARLGPDYPYSAHPSPLPATLSGNGCVVANDYPGNQLTDVASPLWTQDDYGQILSDVTLAAHAGLAGFAVSWAGTGRPHQSPSSSAFNQRLAMVVRAVHQVNQAGTPFSLWIAYISSARIRTMTHMDNDLSYLRTTYGKDPAFDTSNDGRPTLIMMGSRKYPRSVLASFSARWRPHFYLVGDENWNTWNRAKAADFDADQYYWSSQNPQSNPQSFADIARLAAKVRSSRNPDGSAKRFFAPLAPGYDKMLGGGSGCVPRLDGQTMRAIFAGNARANPDGWMVISWNEIDEGTYVMPLERYGRQSLDVLSSIIHSSPTKGAA